jgi:hypothetical protein
MVQWYTSSSSPKQKKSPKPKSPSKTPGTPKTPARELTSGSKRKGRDGLFYRVMTRSNGVNYWQKCGSKPDGGSYCRFVGPARSKL